MEHHSGYKTDEGRKAVFSYCNFSIQVQFPIADLCIKEDASDVLSYAWEIMANFIPNTKVYIAFLHSVPKC